MKFTVGLKKLPFEPDSKQIIYVAGEHDEKVTELIIHHFHHIRDYFQSQGYTFCYIPYVKYDLLTGERLHYNAPFAKSSREADYMVNDNFILDYMIHPENRDKVTPSLLYYDPACRVKDFNEAEDQLMGVTISESSFAGRGDLSGVLQEIKDNIHEHKERLRIRYHRFEDESDEEDVAERRILFRDDEEDEHLADNCFDFESQQLIQEIEERVDKLRQKGIDSYLIEQMFSKRKTMLSRMRITKDFRIYLGDYFGMEIEMTPLPKAVYLLFLRHPEGIRFKDLPDYREELSIIYSHLKPTYDTPASQKSIETVTDPTNNSINEKCARIREAFIRKFDEHIAQNYFITGQRGEPKGIKLPRKYLKWDDEISDLFESTCR